MDPGLESRGVQATKGEAFFPPQHEWPGLPERKLCEDGGSPLVSIAARIRKLDTWSAVPCFIINVI
jgi:hypothetical protein